MNRKAGTNRMHFVSRSLTVLSALVVSVASTELALRVLVERPLLVSEWILVLPGLRDDDVIFLPPHLRSDAHYTLQGASPVLVAMGDSFTAGHPVANADAYPSVLGALLLARGIPTQVIEIGVGDTGPDQQLRAFERDVLARLTPNVVVWQFFPNDEWDNVIKATYRIEESRLAPLDVRRNWLHRRQRIYDAVPFGSLLLRHSLVFRFALKGAERWRTSAVPFADRNNPNRWGSEKIALAVARMQELGREHGFRSYFVLVAPQSAYIDPQKRPPELRGFMRSYERMLEMLRDEPNFIHIHFDASEGEDLLHAHFAGGDRDSLGIGARHFNENGYRLFAERVFARLVSDGALSAAPASPSSPPSPARSSPGS
jgi:lysophospholipase L1-like esterase